MLETETTRKKIINTLKHGRNKPATVPELSERIGSYRPTVRRTVNRMINRHQMDYAGVRRCGVTGKYLFTYHLVD